jgi:hypothetical protein
MALAIDKERTMSPNVNRRIPFRATSSNMSNIFDMTNRANKNNLNGSKIDNNSSYYSKIFQDSNSMISYSNKMAKRNIGYTGKDEMQPQIKFNLNNGKDALS